MLGEGQFEIVQMIISQIQRYVVNLILFWILFFLAPLFVFICREIKLHFIISGKSRVKSSPPFIAPVFALYNSLKFLDYETTGNKNHYLLCLSDAVHFSL